LSVHLAAGRIGTVLGVNPPSRFGQFQTDNGEVLSFEEKPAFSDEWINGGYFFFRREFLQYSRATRLHPREDAPHPPGRRPPALALQAPGFWACMDTQRDLDQLNLIWPRARPVDEPLDRLAARILPASAAEARPATAFRLIQLRTVSRGSQARGCHSSVRRVREEITMKFTDTPIVGACLIDLDKRGDDRGFFARLFCAREFADHRLASHFVQVNNSLSSEKGTLRGSTTSCRPRRKRRSCAAFGERSGRDPGCARGLAQLWPVVRGRAFG